jgi:2-(1,2-epoxy-1,2-dihydrophenyl)acetyl-CoA isomerase
MPAEPELKFWVADGIAFIRLNRPTCGNSVNQAVARALLDAALECAARRDIRAVLLDGAGKNFCFGGDVKLFAEAGDRLDALIDEIVTPLHAALAFFARMSAPIVATVRGVAAGGGLGLALFADITLAGHSASFKTAYTALGLSGDAAVTYMLPRLIGVRRARELLLTNRTLSASEALAWGLIDRVCDDSALTDEAFAMARKLADGSPLAHGACKNLLLLDSGNASLEEQLAAEARWMVVLSRTNDAQQAVRSFADKRSPASHGR